MPVLWLLTSPPTDTKQDAIKQFENFMMTMKFLYLLVQHLQFDQEFEGEMCIIIETILVGSTEWWPKGLLSADREPGGAQQPGICLT